MMLVIEIAAGTAISIVIAWNVIDAIKGWQRRRFWERYFGG